MVKKILLFVVFTIFLVITYVEVMMFATGRKPELDFFKLSVCGIFVFYPIYRALKR